MDSFGKGLGWSGHRVMPHLDTPKRRGYSVSGTYRDDGPIRKEDEVIKNEKTLCELQKEYLRYLTLNEYKARTVNSIQARVNRFLDFLSEKEIFYPSEIDKDVLLEYLERVHHAKQETKEGQSYSAVYRGRLFNSLKIFLNYLRNENYLLLNPSQTIPKMRTKTRMLVQTLKQEELAQIIAQIDHTENFGFRDLTLLEILYGTGLRVHEASCLLVEDVSLSNRTLLVRNGKGGTDRMVCYSRYTAKILSKYIRIVRRNLIKATNSEMPLTKGVLFLNIYGQKMSSDGMTRILKRYGEAAGLEKKVTAHLFRHTCATDLLRNGADIRYIQTLLGHAKLTATQIYIHTLTKDLLATIEKHHPYENKRVS